MILRIYKTHDHDLMGLHQTGTLDIAKAAKAAVLAYFKGERFRFDLKPGQYPDSKAMPSVAAFQIEFDDELDEAPGIRKWLDTFVDGYRNCCIKAILRFYLADPCVFLFRRDGWQPGLLQEPEKQVRMAGKPVRGKKGPAQEKKKAAAFPFAGDCGNGAGLSGSDSEQYEGTAEAAQEEKSGYTTPMTTMDVQERREPEEEEEFDAFEALFELRKGN